MSGKVIREMASLFEQLGLNPIVGQIFGLLICAEKPLSLISMAESLSLSKAAVSINIRILEELEYCRKLPRSKDRQHYYQLWENYPERAFRKRIQRERYILQSLKHNLSGEPELTDLLKRRIEELFDFQEILVNAQLQALDTWHRNKEE